MDGVRSFRLSDLESNIVLTQQDIRGLQFAKGSIAAGVVVLMQQMGVTANDLHEVLLAGSFGSYINPSSARTIGLVPWVPVDRIVAVGNSAGEGAKISLLSFREREAANRIPEFIEYVELSGRSEFNDIFTDVLGFPPLQQDENPTADSIVLLLPPSGYLPEPGVSIYVGEVLTHFPNGVISNLRHSPRSFRSNVTPAVGCGSLFWPSSRAA